MGGLGSKKLKQILVCCQRYNFWYPLGVPFLHLISIPVKVIGLPVQSFWYGSTTGTGTTRYGTVALSDMSHDTRCSSYSQTHGLHRHGCLKQRADGTGESFEYFFLHPATTLNWSKNVKTWPTTTFASFIPLQMFTTCFSQLERPTSQVWWCLVRWTFVHVVKTIKMVY